MCMLECNRKKEARRWLVLTPAGEVAGKLPGGQLPCLPTRMPHLNQTSTYDELPVVYNINLSTFLKTT